MSKPSTRPNEPAGPLKKPTSEAGKLAEQPVAANGKNNRKNGRRETVEAIVVAFILAFLFRTFEAEAFVIPTGSMAPTLYGRHKDVNCPKCGTHFAVGASDEVEDDDGYLKPHFRLETAICPNCRYEFNIRDLQPFKGDRILVTKFTYELGEPDRWDVLVFKYPENPKTNYIKRLVGLPGEMLKIEGGDVFARPDNTAEWKILRKHDPNKQRQLQLLVYDNDHPEAELHEHGWPERWAAVRDSGTPQGNEEREDVADWSDDETGWSADLDRRSFQLDRAQAEDGEFRWIRYRHIVPAPTDWAALERGQQVLFNPRPSLVSDYCSYNSYTGGQAHGNDNGFYWVGDLTLNMQVEVLDAGTDGELLFELVEGLRWYRCRVNLATGQATLSSIDRVLTRDEVEEKELATAATKLKGNGTFEAAFANVDDRLCLWINNKLVDFGGKGEYDRPGLSKPTDQDLAPAGIAARGSSVRVSKLLLERDMYYRAERVSRADDDGEYPASEYEYSGPHGRDILARLLTEPEEWYREYKAHSEPAVFSQLGPGEYFVMGDNSPRSKDSRLWPNTRGAERRHAVPRRALVGKAFFIYWPHAVPFMNDGQGYPIAYHHSPHEKTDYPKMSIPFYPQVTRMNRIR